MVHVFSPLLAAVPLLLSLIAPTSGASLLAIDYGTDAFKAALVKPGIAFDVLINRDSKRKTGSLVTLRGDERSYGGAAANLATRFPKDTFSAVKLLLGGTTDSAQALLHKSLYPSNGPAATTSRGTPALSSSTTSYSVEEILAMQFAYAKEMAEDVAGEPVREVVVTVPGWFGQTERTAVKDAIDLAGLRSIGLVNDGTAAAVNYAMTRTFPAEASYHLLYDFGAASLRTTLVSLKSAMLPDPMSLAAIPVLQNVTSLTVHGVGFDTKVGGFAFDRIIRDIMQEDFERAEGIKVGGDARAMAKLLKEALRVKHVLSANVASVARIEGLVGETDFKTTVTREQLETRAAKLAPRFISPIYEALMDANLTVADLESVIMIGGSTRVPMVQAALQAVVGEDKLARNVNADEAAVMGAALYGAGITRGFRTKDIRVQDITPFGIDVSYEADKAATDAETRTVETHLFPALSSLGSKKTLSFKKSSDFAIRFSYAKTGLHSDSILPDELYETTITGLSTAFTNMTEEAIANSTVQVTIELNESTLVSVVKAIVTFPPAADDSPLTMNDRLKGFLGKFGSKTDDAAPDAKDSADDKSEPTTAEMEEMLKSLTPKNSTVRLTVKTVVLERPAMSAEEKTDARKRLREIKTAETKKLQREEARNVLEAYIYKARDLVESDAFAAASTEDERGNIRKKTEWANEWLWDGADAATTKELKSTKSDLEILVQYVNARSTEKVRRPAAIVAFESTIAAAQNFVSSATANASLAIALKEASRFTAAEIEHVSELASQASEWLAGKQVEQAKIAAHEDPAYKIAELEKKRMEVEKELTKLSKKKAPRKTKISKKALEAAAKELADAKAAIETETTVEEPIESAKVKESVPVHAEL